MCVRSLGREDPLQEESNPLQEDPLRILQATSGSICVPFTYHDIFPSNLYPGLCENNMCVSIRPRLSALLLALHTPLPYCLPVL